MCTVKSTTKAGKAIWHQGLTIDCQTNNEIVTPPNRTGTKVLAVAKETIFGFVLDSDEFRKVRRRRKQCRQEATVLW